MGSGNGGSQNTGVCTMTRHPFFEDPPGVNRPLAAGERSRQIFKEDESPIPALHQLCLIKMNSTYLECVDVNFKERGFSTLIAGIGTIILIFITIFPPIIAIIKWPEMTTADRKIALIGTGAIWIFAILLLLFYRYAILKDECFTYTHLPIRFNRKTRRVHVFRKNGSVMTAHWDRLFFFLGHGIYYWDRSVRCHHLAMNEETVLESFMLPHTTTKDDPFLLSFWEFVRLYMEGDEKDLKELALRVSAVVDIADRRESFREGVHHKSVHYRGTNPTPLWYLLVTPFVYIDACFRWLANRTNKIPVWPAKIEAQCKIAPNDPYLRDRDHLAPKGAWKPPREMLEIMRRIL